MPAQAPKLTAEALLSAPRPSPPITNDDGTLGVYTVSTHTFGGETIKEVRVMDMETGSSRQLSADDKIHTVNWIPGSLEEVVYLRTEEKGRTKVFVANARHVSRQRYEIAELDAPIANVKLEQLDGELVAFVFTGLVGPDGNLFNDEAVERKSTARVFDTCNIRVVCTHATPISFALLYTPPLPGVFPFLFLLLQVREGVIHSLQQWNELYKAHLYGLWYTTMSIQGQIWTLSSTYHNILQDTNLELAGLYDVAEATDNFAICTTGIALIARDAASRDVRSRLDTHPFFTPLSSFTSSPQPRGKPMMIVLPEGVGPGESACMRIAPDGSTIGFLHAPAEDLCNRRLYTARVGEYTATDAFTYVPEAQDEKTYEPPTSFEFAGGSSKLILEREDRGRGVLVHIDLESRSNPRAVTTEGTVKSYSPLKRTWDTLLVTSTSFIDSSIMQIIDTATSRVTRTIPSATTLGAQFGLSRNMWSDVYFKGADDLDIHAFVTKPSDFTPSRKYPWVLILHGGPVSAWKDSWSTRVSRKRWPGYLSLTDQRPLLKGECRKLC